MPRKKLINPPKNPIRLEVIGEGSERTLTITVPIPVDTYMLSEKFAAGKKIKPLTQWVQDAVDQALTRYEKAGLEYVSALEKKVQQVHSKKRVQEEK